jgi:hypothetical protein
VTWENGVEHSGSLCFADTEEVTGSNPVAPTTVLAGHSVVDPEPVSLTSWLGRAGAAPHPHRRARGPFQARPLGHQARQRPRSVVVLQANMLATPRCSNARGPALPCPGSAGSDGRPHVGLASSWPVSGRARSQPAPGPDPARSATAAPPPAYAPPPQHRPQADSGRRPSHSGHRRPGATRSVPAVKVARRTDVIPKATAGLTRTRRM